MKKEFCMYENKPTAVPDRHVCPLGGADECLRGVEKLVRKEEVSQM